MPPKTTPVRSQRLSIGDNDGASALVGSRFRSSNARAYRSGRFMVDRALPAYLALSVDA